jgi:hypothetical protein
MRSPYVLLASAVATVFLGLASAAIAQTAQTLTSPIAPGAAAPTFGLEEIGPSNVPIAPGAATRGDSEIERIGSGGGLIAPGPAGSVSGSSSMGMPAVPSTPSVGGRMR